MRRTALCRAAYGLLLLLAPDSLVARAAGGETGSAFSALRRMLGVRHLLQAFALRDSDSTALTAVGAGADLLHASTLLPFAAFDGGRRRAYVLDFVVEVAFAGAAFRSSSDE